MRFLIQWIATERARASIVPETFWYFSFVGGLMLLSYAIYRMDPVFIIGQATGLIIYSRNIYFIWQGKKVDEGLRKSPMRARPSAFRRRDVHQALQKLSQIPYRGTSAAAHRGPCSRIKLRIFFGPNYRPLAAAESRPDRRAKAGPLLSKADRIDAGWSSPVARQAHNLKAVGSNPTPATNLRRKQALSTAVEAATGVAL